MNIHTHMANEVIIYIITNFYHHYCYFLLLVSLLISTELHIHVNVSSKLTFLLKTGESSDEGSAGK